MASRIYKAALGSQGRVIRGAEITEAEAVVEYGAGRDVVVCGGTSLENHRLARRIANAVGPNKRQVPHTKQAGPYALPHFQPQARPPDGHAFYETDHRKAALKP